MISTILSAQITARTMSNVMFIRNTGVLMLSLLYLLPLYFQIPRCTYVSSTGSRPGCVGPRRNAAEYQHHPSKTCWIVFGRSPGRKMCTIITSMSTSWRRACTGKKTAICKSGLTPYGSTKLRYKFILVYLLIKTRFCYPVSYDSLWQHSLYRLHWKLLQRRFLFLTTVWNSSSKAPLCFS